jgi:hypothetical protein
METSGGGGASRISMTSWGGSLNGSCPEEKMPISKIASNRTSALVFTISLLIKSPPGFYIGKKPSFQSESFSFDRSKR